MENQWSKFTLEDKLVCAAAASWGMSRNMTHEEYIKNYNKLLEDTGLGGLKVNPKSAQQKKKEEKFKQKVVKKNEGKKVDQNR